MKQACVEFWEEYEDYGILFIASEELCNEFCEKHKDKLSRMGTTKFSVGTINVVNSLEEAEKLL